MEETALLEDLLAVLEGPFYHSRPCHYHHLLELAQRITEWKTLAPWLGFEATAVEDLDRNRFDEEGKRQAMLRLWKEANGCMATYGHLATLLVQSGRRNLAEFVLNLSKNDPGLLPKPIPSYPGLSNHSSQRSSSCHTPQVGTPRGPPSTYTTPPVSPFRSAQQTASSEPSDNGALVVTNPSVFPAQTQRHQMLVEPMEQQPQGIQTYPQHSLQPQPGIQTSTQDPFGAMCMSKPTPLVPRGVYERVTSVCDRAPSFGLPTHTTTDMMQLTQRIQELEVERQASQERHDLELGLMKKIHDGEKQLLKKHLSEAHTNAKHWELVVQGLLKKLEHMERELYGSRGREETDFGIVFDVTTSTTVSSSTNNASFSRGDSISHEYSTAKSYVYQEEWSATLKYSRRYVECGKQCSGDDAVEDATCIEDDDESRVVVRRLCRQITVCLEEKELQYQEKARSELAARHLKFLEANNRLTEIVSRSLESLNAATESVNVNTPTEYDGLVKDLQWLQSNLEKCRLARHASWP